MLNSEALHSFIASLMQAERNSADGLNSANAVLGSSHDRGHKKPLCLGRAALP